MIVLKSKLCFTSVLSKKLQRRFDENELLNIKCTETISQIMLSTLKITLIFFILLSNVSNIPRTVQFTLIHTFPNRVRYISNHWNKTGECCITKLRKNGSSQVLAFALQIGQLLWKKNAAVLIISTQRSP